MKLPVGERPWGFCLTPCRETHHKTQQEASTHFGCSRMRSSGVEAFCNTDCSENWSCRADCTFDFPQQNWLLRKVVQMDLLPHTPEFDDLLHKSHNTQSEFVVDLFDSYETIGHRTSC